MSAATKQVCTGYRIKCFCGTLTFMTRDAAHEMWSKIDSRYYVKLRCRQCDRWCCAQTVRGRLGQRKCGSWCTEGTGLTCTCECGGSNHGSAYPAGTLYFLH